MKRITLALFPALLFAACQPSGTASDKSAEHEHVQEQHTEAERHQKNLSLNDGKKWKTDQKTLEHAAELEAQLNIFEKSGKNSESDYKALATDLSSELNELVADCKMSGPAHDALHQWLEPVLRDVSALKNTPTAAEGAETVESIKKRVKLFIQYFN